MNEKYQQFYLSLDRTYEVQVDDVKYLFERLKYEENEGRIFFTIRNFSHKEVGTFSFIPSSAKNILHLRLSQNGKIDNELRLQATLDFEHKIQVLWSTFNCEYKEREKLNDLRQEIWDAIESVLIKVLT